MKYTHSAPNEKEFANAMRRTFPQCDIVQITQVERNVFTAEFEIKPLNTLRSCDNVDHRYNTQVPDDELWLDIQTVELTEDFGGLCHWCAYCRHEDKDMIARVL